MSTENWKSNLGKFFTMKGLYREDELNSLLESATEELASYLHEFNKVSVKRIQISKYQSGEVDQNVIKKMEQMEVTISHVFTFVCQVGFFAEKERLFLRIRWTDQFNPSINSKVTHQWTEEEFDEPEIFEKEYLIQLLVNRLKEYYKGKNF